MSLLELLAVSGKFVFAWGMTGWWIAAVLLFMADWIQLDRTYWVPREKRNVSVFFGVWGIVVAVVQLWWWRT